MPSVTLGANRASLPTGIIDDSPFDAPRVSTVIFGSRLINEESKMTKIKGKGDGPGGRNEHYDVGGRKDVPRRNIVAEIKRGEHPDAHVVKIKGREYARDNPDPSKKDNVNRDK